ncbi:hypothetical protein FP830_00850 [Candidatus Falkowbacteria bacterium]|nr:hypothetical protein [Candidatus Falkowbacteria bacterium]
MEYLFSLFGCSCIEEVCYLNI